MGVCLLANPAAATVEHAWLNAKNCLTNSEVHVASTHCNSYVSPIIFVPWSSTRGQPCSTSETSETSMNAWCPKDCYFAHWRSHIMWKGHPSFLAICCLIEMTNSVTERLYIFLHLVTYLVTILKICADGEYKLD